MPNFKNKKFSQEVEASAKRVITFMNEKLGSNFQPYGISLYFIASRIEEGATEEQCRQVIAMKKRQWVGNKVMEPHLVPKTIFNETNFSQYVGQLGSFRSDAK